MYTIDTSGHRSTDGAAEAIVGLVRPCGNSVEIATTRQHCCSANPPPIPPRLLQDRRKMIFEVGEGRRSILGWLDGPYRTQRSWQGWGGLARKGRRWWQPTTSLADITLPPLCVHPFFATLSGEYNPQRGNTLHNNKLQRECFAMQSVDCASLSFFCSHQIASSCHHYYHHPPPLPIETAPCQSILAPKITA